MAVIWWMRRDLRLSDNVALHEALQAGERVIPVFIVDTNLLKINNMGAARTIFCFESVKAVDARLREAGAGYVVVRHGDPLRELPALIEETKATAIYANRDYTPLARHRDEAMTEAVAALGITLNWFKDGMVFEPDEILTHNSPYTVYTPYYRKWRAMTPPKPVTPAWPDVPRLQTPANIRCDDFPSIESLNLPGGEPTQPPGEAGVWERINEWFDLRRAESLGAYSEHRNLPPLDYGTSRLSPYIRFGCVSTRTLYQLALQKMGAHDDEEIRRNAEVWISELAWRDFYYQALYHYPDSARQSFTPKYRFLQRRHDPQALAAWQEGKTGYPYIDAAMRQMRESGFMHNRARMAVASFLTKDLLIDWLDGYDHFMRYLTDGDAASNNGGWQWAASTGPSSQPYYRVFNPVSQGKKHDPEGEYVRRWVPELQNVPLKFLHNPWLMSAEEQQAAGCIIGTDYPAPIVDHAEQREQALKLYKEA